MNAVVIAAEIEMDEDALRAAEAQRVAHLDEFGAKLEPQKDEAIQARSGVERRWVTNLLAFHDRIGVTPQAKDRNIATGSTNTAEYLASNDNIIKPKVTTVAARISDILFPTNDRNWGLKPSDMPSLPDAQTFYEAEAVSEIKAEAQRRCERMQSYISDQLGECDYAASGRLVIDDGCLYGIGIIKGPFVHSVRRKLWAAEPGPDNTVVPMPRITYENKPASRRVDPWNFYPQPCRRIEEAEYVFELNVLTKKQVRALAKEPGFDVAQVNRLLGEEPKLGALTGAYMMRRDNITTGQAAEIIRDRFAVWEYHGPIPRECLEAMGQSLPEDDNITSFEGEVWFSQGIVLKAVLSHMECSERLPYYVWCYESDPNDVFGFGVVDQALSDQLAVTQTWHAIILNTMMSAGPQLGIVSGTIIPTDGKRDVSCTRPKVWAMEGVDDINKALSIFTIPNVTGPLLDVYLQAKQNCRDRTLLPYFEKEPPAQLGNTLGGLAMVINADNIVTRRSAKSWDDNITIPHIGAYNDWNMLYNPDPQCKGDFEPIATGASQLMVKDMTTQHVMTLASTASATPLAQFFDQYKIATIVADNFASVTGLPVRETLKTPEQLATEQQSEPPDPKIVTAEIDAAVRREEMAGKERMAQLDAEVRLQISQNDVIRSELAVAADERISLADVQAKMGTEQAREATKRLQAEIASQDSRFKVGVDARLKAEQIAQQEASEQRQVALESPVRLA